MRFKISDLGHACFGGLDLRRQLVETGGCRRSFFFKLGVFQQIVENYSPAEFIKEKDKKVFKDFNEQDEYYRRFIIRPTENLVNGTTTMDEEYSIKVEDDD